MKNDLETPREDVTSRGVFAFWRDPVCLGSWALYLLNRFLLIRYFGQQFPFLAQHGDDALFLPAALPPFLWVRQQLRLRGPRGAPTWREIIVITLLCSVAFEWLGPKFLGHSVGDWGDVLAYWAGALVAGTIWNWRKMKRG
jgi:hypothetical protein